MKLIPPLVCCIALSALAAPAFGGLGGDAASVESDLVRMRGALRVTAGAGFTVHELTFASGVLVREYLSPDSRVFAVSWRGPGIPDLRQMLGSYYDQFAQAASSARRGDRHHLTIEQPGLVVQSSGHMRAFFGRAWAPGLLPRNFSTARID
jgi:hypothetical protein